MPLVQINESQCALVSASLKLTLSCVDCAMQAQLKRCQNVAAAQRICLLNDVLLHGILHWHLVIADFAALFDFIGWKRILPKPKQQQAACPSFGLFDCLPGKLRVRVRVPSMRSKDVCQMAAEKQLPAGRQQKIC